MSGFMYDFDVTVFRVGELQVQARKAAHFMVMQRDEMEGKRSVQRQM